MCHLATSLDCLPKILGFNGTWKKGFFPHTFNVPANQNYIGPLPSRSFCEPEEMKEQRKQDFEKWYCQEQGNYQDSTWDFQQNLVEYCKADVMVLSKALEVYDTLMKELNEVALEDDYKVSKVYKAWVYQKHSDLFKTYIRKFLKIKLEASGIPAHIDWETFAKNHRGRLGIILEREKMVRNEGMRAMAKLLLNSLWGKLGQDPCISQNQIYGSSRHLNN